MAMRQVGRECGVGFGKNKYRVEDVRNIGQGATWWSLTKSWGGSRYIWDHRGSSFCSMEPSICSPERARQADLGVTGETVKARCTAHYTARTAQLLLLLQRASGQRLLLLRPRLLWPIPRH